MSELQPIPIRERARRATRRELTLLAQDLFTTRGYEQTTVDDLVAAAGISKRTFFRYFTSKEDLVLGEHDAWIEMLVGAFTSRPDDEPVWTALRRTFDVVVDRLTDEGELARTLALDRIVHADPALAAGELERITRAQDRLAELVARRTGQHPRTDPRPSAIVGAALACLIAAKNTWITDPERSSFARLLDDAMGALAPALTPAPPGGTP